jgi:hypothetical protein
MEVVRVEESGGYGVFCVVVGSCYGGLRWLWRLKMKIEGGCGIS